MCVVQNSGHLCVMLSVDGCDGGTLYIRLWSCRGPGSGSYDVLRTVAAVTQSTRPDIEGACGTPAA